MKKIILNYSFFLALAGLVILSSCSKDEERPLPVSTADFEITSVAPEVHLPVNFENKSNNASSYAWDFGDGTTDSITSSQTVSHVYETPGNYTVKLRSYNNDGAFEESEKVVFVGERFLTGMLVFALGGVDMQGSKIQYDTVRGIDLMLEMGPLDDPSRVINPSIIIDSVGAKSSLPNGYSITNEYILGNEGYYIALLRVDSLDEDNIYRTLLDYEEFNPLNPVNSIKGDDGLGAVYIPIIAFYGFQYLLEFEIK